MRILILCGQMSPAASNNATLLSKLLPFLQVHHELRLLATDRKGRDPSLLPDTVNGLPVYWLSSDRSGRFRRTLRRLVSQLLDPGGYSDAQIVFQYCAVIRRIRREWRFDAVLSVLEPYPAAIAAACQRGVRKITYFMDPPPAVRGEADTPYRMRMMRRILRGTDVVVTTPFCREAISAGKYRRYSSKVVPVGFPIVTAQTVRARKTAAEPGKLRLLFCGWLYSGIRSPKYFLDIVSRLDERFTVTFMGKECTQLRKRFEVQTKAELITLPQQPYETALQAMADADILINIGNSVPVHMPSKTLEYINTGKPFVNFYKMDDCPTLYYTKRYPLCLNLSEGDPDLDAAAERFIAFCENSRGKTVDRAFIEEEYAECTPETITQELLDALNP